MGGGQGGGPPCPAHPQSCLFSSSWSQASGRPGLGSTGPGPTPKACESFMQPFLLLRRTPAPGVGQPASHGDWGRSACPSVEPSDFPEGQQSTLSLQNDFCLFPSLETRISHLVPRGPRVLFPPLPHPPGLFQSSAAFGGLCPDDSCKLAKPRQVPSSFSEKNNNHVSKCRHQTTKG